MEITYYGHSCFRIKGKSASIVTDPFDPEKVGMKMPALEADIITISHSHEGHSNPKAVGPGPVVVPGPGEYEVKGVKIIGIQTYHDNQKGETLGKNIIYRIEIDGISIVHLGDLGHKLGEKEVEAIDDVAVLMVPVGGIYTLNSSGASEVISQLEPKVVIPMHYRMDGMRQDIYGSLNDVAGFLKEIGKEDVVPQPKFLVNNREKIPQEMTIVLLEVLTK